MMWELLLWALTIACVGGLVTAIWTVSMRQAAEKQRIADGQELRQIRQQAANAAANAYEWQEKAHQRDVELAYLHGMEAGRNDSQRQRLPAAQEAARGTDKPLEAEGYILRPPVGRRA